MTQQTSSWLTPVRYGAWLVASLVLSGCSVLGSAHDGYVKRAAPEELLICFEPDAAPAVGQQVRVVRREAAGGPKAPTIFRERVLGLTRLTDRADERCFSAAALGGARRFDDVMLSTSE
jgi:hypothetical protein